MTQYRRVQDLHKAHAACAEIQAPTAQMDESLPALNCVGANMFPLTPLL